MSFSYPLIEAKDMPKFRGEGPCFCQKIIGLGIRRLAYLNTRFVLALKFARRTSEENRVELAV